MFNDTWSQQGHLVLCITIFFLSLQIARFDIRPHITWTVSLVIAYCHLNFSRVCVGMYGLITYSVYQPRGVMKWEREKAQPDRKTDTDTQAITNLYIYAAVCRDTG